jgi:hypothetical protein
VLALLLIAAPRQPGVVARQQAHQPGRPVTLRGRVVDARTGEPISKVKIIVVGSQQSATTDEDGTFILQNLVAGEVELYVTTVGYGLVKKTVTLKEGKNELPEIALSQEAAVLTEQITVTTGPYEQAELNAASEQSLNKAELQSLSTVLVGDPVRAAQALPGVAANDDFRSEFAVRGAGFDRVGIYIDGILTGDFVHTVHGNFLNTGSLSVISADTIGALSLLGGAFPAKYGDSTAAVLSIETREGNRVKPSGRIAASLSNASAVFDGPFAKGHAAWLLAARKSYFGYLVRRVSKVNQSVSDLIIDFDDAQGKAVYDVSPHNQLGISVIFGDFNFERNRPRSALGSNSIKEANSRNLLVNAHWTYIPSDRLLAQARLFGVRQYFTNTNRDALTLDDGHLTQVGARGDVNFLAWTSQRIEAGLYVRSLGAKEFSERFQFSPSESRNRTSFDRRATEQSYYGQQTWSNERRGLSLTVGGRIEHSELTGETLLSPRAGFALAVKNNWRIRAGFGKHYQFPDFDELFGRLGNQGLRAESAVHYNFSVERVFGSRMRMLAEAYDREDSNLFFSLNEPRIENGRVTLAELPFRNSLRGHARGIELTLQRRSANGLTGWISYSYSKARLRDERAGLSFVSDFDQRHILNVYASYRFTAGFNLSGELRYASGLPMPGFFRQVGADLFLAGERNLVRLPAYSRVDLRTSKALLFKRWKMTLYGEVLNVLNQKNLRYVGLRGFGPEGHVFIERDKMLPILPSAGMAIEF